MAFFESIYTQTCKDAQTCKLCSSFFRKIETGFVKMSMRIKQSQTTSEHKLRCKNHNIMEVFRIFYEQPAFWTGWKKGDVNG